MMKMQKLRKQNILKVGVTLLITLSFQGVLNAQTLTTTSFDSESSNSQLLPLHYDSVSLGTEGALVEKGQDGLYYKPSWQELDPEQLKKPLHEKHQRFLRNQGAGSSGGGFKYQHTSSKYLRIMADALYYRLSGISDLKFNEVVNKHLPKGSPTVNVDLQLFRSFIRNVEEAPTQERFAKNKSGNFEDLAFSINPVTGNVVALKPYFDLYNQPMNFVVGSFSEGADRSDPKIYMLKQQLKKRLIHEALHSFGIGIENDEIAIDITNKIVGLLPPLRMGCGMQGSVEHRIESCSYSYIYGSSGATPYKSIVSIGNAKMDYQLTAKDLSEDGNWRVSLMANADFEFDSRQRVDYVVYDTSEASGMVSALLLKFNDDVYLNYPTAATLLSVEAETGTYSYEKYGVLVGHLPQNTSSICHQINKSYKVNFSDNNWRVPSFEEAKSLNFKTNYYATDGNTLKVYDFKSKALIDVPKYKNIWSGVEYSKPQNLICVSDAIE